jgi:hypothetical protein
LADCNSSLVASPLDNGLQIFLGCGNLLFQLRNLLVFQSPLIVAERR